MKEIYLVRHGRTYINRYNKMQGWCDTPLTQEGIDGAKKVAEALKDVPFDIAISSDTKRASDTCEIIMAKNRCHQELQHITSPFFREQFYGFFEGMNSDEAWRMIAGPHGCQGLKDLLDHYTINEIKDMIHESDPFHQAEDAKTYWQRLDRGLDMIAQLDGADKVLLVTHGFTIRSLVARFGKDKFDVKTSPRNASITMMQMSGKSITIKAYNQLTLTD